jgi:predicted ATPase/DNA-binding CsgD family transcriptional regulator
MLAAVRSLHARERAQSLPDPFTSFVGREQERAEVRDALGASRLVTLTGPGGCGKTRLAIRVAADTAERFPDGVWWVDLAPLRDEELVGAAIAQALAVRPLPGATPLQAAAVYLAPRQALVVLDNCEHLVEACAGAAEALLRAGSGVVVLATSRAPLGVAGETDWRVPSLSRSDAVELFLDRARKVRPGFALTDENTGAVMGVCTAFDGLPLAIELAAARVRMLSVEQIATGVDKPLRLLTGGPRTAEERHQTLRASVDWSHSLLSEDEQVLFRRLSVFAGGCTLEAIEAVSGGDVLDVLGSLVDQSLVIAEERDGAARYRMLETVRQYALERLAEAGEEDAIRDRHRDAYLALAEEAGPKLDTGAQLEWFERLDPEAANIAAAVEHALATEPSMAIRFSVALYRWWYGRGRLAEGDRTLARSLDAAPGADPGLRSRATRDRAFIAFGAGDLSAVQSYGTEALALAEEAGDLLAATMARCVLGNAAMFTIRPAAGRTEFARAAELADRAGDDWARAITGQLIAMTYLFESDHVQAARAEAEAAEPTERVGDPFLVGRGSLFIGQRAVTDGRLAEAREALERAREAVSGVGEPLVDALADSQLAGLEVWSGEPQRALDRCHAGLERALTLGVGMAVPLYVLPMAFAELTLGHPEEARARLEGLRTVVDPRFALVTAAMAQLLSLALAAQDDPAAEATAAEAQELGERLGNRLMATSARMTLARLAADSGDWKAAREHVLSHLDACVEGGHRTYFPLCLVALAEVAAGLGRDIDAVRLFAAAERIEAEIGVARFEVDHWAAIESGLRDRLGVDGYEAARLEGAELSTEEVVAWARRARGPRRRPPGGWAALTPTEEQVVELAAQGLTNPQIGERMFISRATVKVHLSHVFKKLDVHTRAELAAQVAQRNGAK